MTTTTTPVPPAPTTPLHLSVIGCGYLGAVHAAAMTSLGHHVVGIDVDPHKVSELAAGRAPFYEPGLPELLTEAAATDRLTFTTDPAAAADATVHFICVGTPQQAFSYAADLTCVHAAVDALLPHLKPGDVVVGKSTVPVGTAQAIAERVSATEPSATVVWNPEFLREGFAVADTLHPDRIVYGLPDHPAAERAKDILDQVYAAPINEGSPVVVTDLATSELVKVAANSFLATKISFINAMAELCETTGADVVALADAIGHDDRIGRKFLGAGLGFGGGCLPKDIRAFMARADELGADQTLSFLAEVDAINMRRRARTVDLVREACGGSVAGKTVTVLGAAFKPNSDDIRDSPALAVADQLRKQGAHVVVTDPQALGNAAREYPHLSYATNVEAAAAGADVVVLATEWAQYRTLDPASLGKVVASKVVVDGRNVLDPGTWRGAGWTYRALGRP